MPTSGYGCLYLDISFFNRSRSLLLKNNGHKLAVANKGCCLMMLVGGIVFITPHPSPLLEGEGTNGLWAE